MKSYPAGATVKITLPLIDLSGDPVTPTGLSYIVNDIDGTLVVPSTTLMFETNDTDVEVTILGLENRLEPGAASGGRNVVLSIATADGVFYQDTVYRLQGYQRLIPPRNSFVTDAAGQVLALDIPGLDAIQNAEATTRQAALIEAHARIIRMALNPAPCTGNRVTLGAEDWLTMTPEAFKLMPVGFRKALFRAQLREADALLAFDPVRSKRSSGIVSETVGESSMSFRSGKLIDAPLAAAAMTELSAHIVFSNRIVRV